MKSLDDTGEAIIQKMAGRKDIRSEAEFQIPADSLIRGDNSIVIMNMTPDKEVDGAGGVNYTAKRNYYWGWFMIADIKIELGQ